VPAILLADPRNGLNSEQAASRLGTDPVRFTAAIQLGSQRNFDYEALPELLVSELMRRNFQVVNIANPLARPQEKAWPGVVNSTLYPIADCLSAIDLMITNAGYNSFHECIFGGVPSIFVPNESPEMDDQQLRAAYADAAGLGLRLRAAEIGRAKEVLDRALSDDFRDEMRRRSKRLEFVNGALAAARLIEELVFSVRTNVPLNARLPRA
jgi:UDP:flavonoid glycosyltransferase YjiC (YdhE family)